MNDPRGSVWRRWDLHFHTPSSFDYGDGSVKNSDIVEGLVAAGVRVVAITDHHVIDVDRIRSLQTLAKDRLTILPGIELRSDQGGDPIHYIGLFPETIDLEYLRTCVQGQLNLTPQDIQQNGGDQKIYVPIEKAAPVIRELGGLISIHAGEKSNSIESIKNREQFQMRIKYDITRRYVDLMEVGQIKDVAVHQKRIFPATGLDRPLLICSDNHNINNYRLKACCWIKADPTLRGLRQVIHEPLDRVFLGEIPPKREEAKKHSTKYISHVYVKKSGDAKHVEGWFDAEIPLNHDLVAIIGRKGSGKSALADILGLCGNGAHHADFSFLNARKFCHSKNGKAEHFETYITWASGESCDKKRLSAKVRLDDAERVKYIPQNYLEKICNDFMDESPFDKELKAVIYSHVSTAERREKASLDELIEYLTTATKARLATLRKDVRELNASIVQLEQRGSRENREAIEKAIVLKSGELEAHLRTKPIEVTAPEAGSDSDPDITVQIQEARGELEAVQAEVARIRTAQARNTLRMSSIQRLSQYVSNFEKEFKDFTERVRDDVGTLEIELDRIIELRVDRTVLEAKEREVVTDLASGLSLLNPDNVEGAERRRAKLEETIAGLQAKLEGPQRAYQAYVSALQTWEKRRLEILGAADAVGSLEYHRAALNDLAHVPELLAALGAKRMEKTLEIYQAISSLATSYRKLYQPVQDVVLDHPLVRDRFRLNFQVSIVQSGFEVAFWDRVHQGRSGSFQGTDAGKARLRNLLDGADFSSAEGVQGFVTVIMESLSTDKRETPPKPLRVSEQLKAGHKPEDLYNLIFSLDYLSPRYTLRLGEKELDQLSPGERGTLLLMFFLLVDRDNIPLIIDQPEENLDNQTVHELLVPCIKDAKRRRQLILVTHNPNLAVVCDAEQVIHAALDGGAASRITYSTGAIEKPDINRYLVDVLEGTRPAFDNRDGKYFAPTTH